MRMNKKTLLIAMAAAMPWLGAHAQSNAELLQQIQALQAQLKALQAKVEQVNQPRHDDAGLKLVSPVEPQRIGDLHRQRARPQGLATVAQPGARRVRAAGPARDPGASAPKRRTSGCAPTSSGRWPRV